MGDISELKCESSHGDPDLETSHLVTLDPDPHAGQNGNVVVDTSEKKDQLKNGHVMEEHIEGETQSLTPESHPVHVAPDGGWGWLVCFTAFMAHGSLMSMMNTFGFIFVELLNKYEGQTTNLAFKTCEYCIVTRNLLNVI